MNKANQGNLEFLSRHVEQNFTKMDKFMEFRDKNGEKHAELDDEISRLAMLQKKLQDNHNNVSQNHESRLVVVEKTSQLNKQQIEKFKRTIDERNDLIQKIVKDVERLDDKKAGLTDHLELKGRLDVFESVESIKAIKEIFMPRVTSFIALVDKLEASHEEMHKIIRDFDHNMTGKANKSTVNELIEEQGRQYIVKTDLDALDVKYNKLLDQIEENGQDLIEKMERLREHQLREVTEAVSTEVSRKLKEYSRVCNQFK